MLQFFSSTFFFFYTTRYTGLAMGCITFYKNLKRHFFFFSNKFGYLCFSSWLLSNAIKKKKKRKNPQSSQWLGHFIQILVLTRLHTIIFYGLVSTKYISKYKYFIVNIVHVLMNGVFRFRPENCESDLDNCVHTGIRVLTPVAALLDQFFLGISRKSIVALKKKKRFIYVHYS